MKVTFEIDDNMLKVAAGIVAMADLSCYDEIIEHIERIGKKDVVISQERLKFLSTQNDNYKQLPLLIAIIAIGVEINDEEAD